MAPEETYIKAHPHAFALAHEEKCPTESESINSKQRKVSHTVTAREGVTSKADYPQVSEFFKIKSMNHVNIFI